MCTCLCVYVRERDTHRQTGESKRAGREKWEREREKRDYNTD